MRSKPFVHRSFRCVFADETEAGFVFESHWGPLHREHQRDAARKKNETAEAKEREEERVHGEILPNRHIFEHP